MTGSEIPKPRLICIVGPTAVGKTGMALELAGQWGGEIVGADSMQVYRHMDIGTAKPKPQERARIRHHLLDVVDPDEPFDASRYIELAHGAIDRLQRQGKPVFVVGGTGLYIRALLGGLIDGPGADEALRRQLKEEMKRYGKAHLHKRLQASDPRAAAQIHPHDGIRIVRALEVLELTGRSIVEHQQEHRFREEPYEALRIGLELDRERLNDRIDRRTEQMVADGWGEEVRRLLDMGYDQSLKSMQSLGYRHMVSFLAGRQSLGETVRLIQRDTRLYAKRQMTWFAADRKILWMKPADVQTASAQVGIFLNRL
jgi:tRNA dimethylallyltransferase